LGFIVPSFAPSIEAIRFGEFEANLRSRELRRNGSRVRLPDQSFAVLAMLLEHPGELVGREDVRNRLWPADTFVDFDHGLNNAVNRLRDALGESAESPRFLETLPRRGYRFIGDVERLEARAPVLTSKPATTSSAPDTRRTIFVVSMGAFALLLAIFFFSMRRWRSHGAATHLSHPIMLAVLPFENLSGDRNQDYFSDGLTEEMIAQLGALSPDKLGVIARTTSMAYKHTSKSVRQIGGELGVDYILESSVRRDGDQLRISTQLIRTHDQVHLWAHSYDRQISNSITLQEEVARAVAAQIEVNLSPLYTHRTANPHPLDPQASEAYLRGRYFSNQFTGDGYRKAITYFQQAIDLDPSFAEAYSGLADSYVFLVVTDVLSPTDGSYKALDSAHRAVSLGENVAESHNSLANVMMNFRWDWSGAEPEFKRAIELNPSYSNEHRIYAAFLAAMGRHREAWEQISQAMRTDPLSLPNNAEVVRTLYYARDYDQALEQGQKALQLDPNYYRIHFWLARVYAQKKMYEETIAESNLILRTLPDSNMGLTELAYGFAVVGRERESREILQRLEERSKHAFVPAYDLAVIRLALNDKDAALNYLQKAYQERDWAMFVLQVEPRLDPLRSDLRFQALSRKMNFPQPNSRE
jgi:TolB-like protein/DNA-binding winged helix-turn-helix (wHTH) protein